MDDRKGARDPLARMSEQERNDFVPLSDGTIRTALEEGAQARRAALESVQAPSLDSKIRYR